MDSTSGGLWAAARARRGLGAALWLAGLGGLALSGSAGGVAQAEEGEGGGIPFKGGVRGGGGIPLEPAEAPLGAIEATFDVDSAGGAAYSIPIKVPPGSLGVEPRISLQYSSHGGDDIAGVGFRLSGLSRIERCAPTVAQDGYPGAVEIAGDDRYCLDGLRLVDVEGGGYHAADAVYHTEGETWSRILPQGSCGDGPCTFEVTLKSGTTAVYGRDGGLGCSAVAGEKDPASSPMDWPLTRMTDLHGNYLEIDYTSVGTHQCAPSRIWYTGNDHTGDAPLRSVDLSYDHRPDVVPRYLGDVPYSLAKRLANIRTYVAPASDPSARALVKEYRLDYEIGAHTQRSRLKQLFECDAAGRCLPPTRFDWQDGDWMTQTSDLPIAGPSYQLPWPGHDASFPGDFDGSGALDYLQLYAQTATAYSSTQLLNDASGSDPIFHASDWINPKIEDNLYQRFHVGDFNGDGYNDILLLGLEGYNGWTGWRIYAGGPQGLAGSPTLEGPSPDLSDKVYVGDFTGDGRSDVVTFRNLDVPTGEAPDYEGWRLYAWEGDAFSRIAEGEFVGGANPAILSDSEKWNPNNASDLRFHVGDYNGDGRVDFLATMQLLNTDSSSAIPYHGWKLFLSNGLGFDLSDSGIWPYGRLDVLSADFNDDGLTDVLLNGDHEYYGVPYGHVLLLASGSTFIPQLSVQQTISVSLVGSGSGGSYAMTWGITGAFPDSRYVIRQAEFNDDGRADLFVTYDPKQAEIENGFVEPEDPNPVHDTAHMLISLGDRFTEVRSFPSDLSSPFLLGDFKGIGRSAMLKCSPTTGYYWYSRVNQKPDLLTGITNGVGGTFSAEYQPMTSSEVYQKGGGASWPVRDYIASRYVVSYTTRGDGAGNLYADGYFYEGAQTDVSGRGFLAFERVTVKHYYDNTRTITEYRQDFPFAGAVRSEEQWYKSERLSRVEYGYTNRPDVDAPGTFQILKTTKKTRLYQDDQLVSQALVTYQHDTWGNVTSVADYGEIGDAEHALFTEMSYYNDTKAWRLGYVEETATYDGTIKLLSDKLLEYDDEMNITFEGRYDDKLDRFIGTEQTYDAHGNADTSMDPLGGITRLTYDDYQLLQATTNALGHVTGRRIDPAFGVEVERTNENGGTQVFLLDGFGRVTSIRGPDPKGDEVELQRFAQASAGAGLINLSYRRQDWSATPDWTWKEDHYDALGRLIRSRRRGEGDRAIVTDQVYQGLDRVYKSSKPYFEGDAPQWSVIGYDGRGRPVGVDLPGGQKSRTTYLDATRTLLKEDPNQAVTRLVMDARGKMIEKTDPDGHRSAFGYDALGRTVAVLDPEGNTTQTRYDTLGRKVEVLDSSTGRSAWTYDDTGHLVEEADAKGQRVVRDYDALDRTVRKSYFDKGGLEPVKVVEFEYDDPSLQNSVGQLSHVSVYQRGELESRYTFIYDHYGHQEYSSLEIDDRTFTWWQSYDPTGSPTQLVYPDGSILKTRHTTGGNLSALSLLDAVDGQGYVDHATWGGYDAEGRAGQLAYANQVVTCYTYDPARGTLTHVTAGYHPQVSPDQCGSKEEATTQLIDYGYLWDDVNNIKEITDGLNPSRTQQFTYDGRGQLRSAVGAYGQLDYEYDGAGDLIQQDGVSYAYTGQQVSASSAGLEAIYDANGNLVTRRLNGSESYYSWDPDDLLTSVERDGRLSTYVYDASGNRIKATDPEGRITYYISDQYEITLLPDGKELHTKYVPGPAGRLVQITHSDVGLTYLLPVTGAGMRKDMYALTNPTGAALAVVWGAYAQLLRLDDPRAVQVALLVLALLAAGGLMILAGLPLGRPSWRPRYAVALAPVVILAVVVSLTFQPAVAQAMAAGANGSGIPEVGISYLHQNHIGSTTLTTDEGGAEVSRMDYLPWGGVDHKVSAGPDNFRPKFGGHELGADTGLYYVHARYYDPELGRFISPDRSVGGDILKTASLNRYAWAGNNPVTFADPSGHFFFAFLIATAVCMVAGMLILGTGGKILTDPAHAFDNWSWTRAIVGLWAGMMAGIAGFGLGTLGVGTTASVFGIPAGTVAASTFGGGVTSLAFAYAGGEQDGLRLLAYFGIGLLAGFASGCGGFGLVAKVGSAGRVLAEAMSSMASSALKKAVNLDSPWAITIWAFTLAFDKNNDVSVSPSVGYLVGIGLNLFQAAGLEVDGPTLDEMGFDLISEDAKGKHFIEWLAPKMPMEWGPKPAEALYDLAGAVSKGMLGYGLHQYIKSQGLEKNIWDPVKGMLEGGMAGDAWTSPARSAVADAVRPRFADFAVAP